MTLPFHSKLGLDSGGGGMFADLSTGGGGGGVGVGVGSAGGVGGGSRVVSPTTSGRVVAGVRCQCESVRSGGRPTCTVRCGTRAGCAGGGRGH